MTVALLSRALVVGLRVGARRYQLTADTFFTAVRRRWCLALETNSDALQLLGRRKLRMIRMLLIYHYCQLARRASLRGRRRLNLSVVLLEDGRQLMMRVVGGRLGAFSIIVLCGASQLLLLLDEVLRMLLVEKRRQV